MLPYFFSQIINILGKAMLVYKNESIKAAEISLLPCLLLLKVKYLLRYENLCCFARQAFAVLN